MADFQFKNTWGTRAGSDVQRSDLWYIDLRSLILMLKNPTGVTAVSSEYSELVDIVAKAAPENLLTRCTLPEEMMEVVTAYSGMQPRHLPGMDAPLGPCRIDFFHEVNKGGVSASYSLLKAWQHLSLAGSELEYGKRVLVLTDAASKPSYKADLPLIFIQGGYSIKGTTIQGEVVASTDIEVVLKTSAKYTLKGCWIGDIQFNDITTESSEVLEFSATLYVESIRHVPASSASL